VKIRITREAEVPEGPVCVNWAYRTNMPPEQNVRCDYYRRDSQTVSDRDMGGFSDRTSQLYSSRCALFDVGLHDEAGVGPHKCRQCLAAAPAAQDQGEGNAL
jgi:hypothetical protein